MNTLFKRLLPAYLLLASFATVKAEQAVQVVPEEIIIEEIVAQPAILPDLQAKLDEFTALASQFKAESTEKLRQLYKLAAAIQVDYFLADRDDLRSFSTQEVRDQIAKALEGAGQLRKLLAETENVLGRFQQDVRTFAGMKNSDGMKNWADGMKKK